MEKKKAKVFEGGRGCAEKKADLGTKKGII